MGSPKHLWSGDWEEESAAARARARGPAQAPAQAPAQPPAPPAVEPAPPRVRRPPRPRRRLRMSRQELRRWALAGGIALVAGFIVTSAVSLIGRGDTSRSTAASASGQPVWMGVEMRTWPGGGAMIERVVAGGPADAAGLAPGDLITGIDNDAVSSAADVRAALSRRAPGQVVAVHARRVLSAFTAQVTLASPPPGGRFP